MNRREVFGRLAGMTAAAASLTRIKAPRKAEPSDYKASYVANTTQTLTWYCGQCHGQIYGWYDGRSHVCRGCR